MQIITQYGFFETNIDGHFPLIYNKTGDKMFENVENLKLLDIVTNSSSLHLIRNCRADHGFIFKISGASRYEFEQQTIDLKEGDMLYIPKGSNYTVKRISQCDSKFVAVCFDGSVQDGLPRLYQAKNFTDIRHICSTLERLWLMRSPADEYKCISIFYEILSQICMMEEKTYQSSRQYQILEPAVEHLKTHIFDSALSIRDLSELCGISETYFRKLFQTQFGITPQKYMIHKRLEQAKAILDHGEFHSIGEVALQVGYEDALYFSRAFKEKYGTPPSRI